MKFKILIADDHALVRAGLKAVFENENNFEIFAEAANGFEVLNLLENGTPDIIIMDIDMPELNGIETLKKIRANKSDIKILILTMHVNHTYIFDALSAGVNGYILKMSKMEEVLNAVNSILEGNDYFAEEVTSLAMSNYRKFHDENKTDNEKNVYLTPREKEIIKYITAGFKYKKIAETLFISQFTVINHRQNIMQKTGLKSNAELVIYAIQNGLI